VIIRPLQCRIAALKRHAHLRRGGWEDLPEVFWSDELVEGLIWAAVKRWWVRDTAMRRGERVAAPGSNGLAGRIDRGEFAARRVAWLQDRQSQCPWCRLVVCPASMAMHASAISRDRSDCNPSSSGRIPVTRGAGLERIAGLVDHDERSALARDDARPTTSQIAVRLQSDLRDARLLAGVKGRIRRARGR
jgi:hypothetical protein